MWAWQHECERCKNALKLLPIEFGKNVYYFPHGVGLGTVFGTELAHFLSIHNGLTVGAIERDQQTPIQCPGVKEIYYDGFWVTFH